MTEISIPSQASCREDFCLPGAATAAESECNCPTRTLTRETLTENLCRVFHESGRIDTPVAETEQCGPPAHSGFDRQLYSHLGDSLRVGVSKRSLKSVILISADIVGKVSIHTLDTIEELSTERGAFLILALVASGTATLETALLGVPMVIVYKISLLSYVIGRLFVHVKNIGLVNIIAGKTIVPELIQGDACGKRIAEEALSILKNGERKKEMIKELEAIRAKLGEPGAAIRAAQIACDMI